MVAQIAPFYDSQTGTISYVVYDHNGGDAAIIDSVLNYDGKSGRTATTSADHLVAFITAHDLRLKWLLETHAHADHLSAAPYLKSKLGGKIGIGQGIRQVQRAFSPIFNLDAVLATDGSQFDHLFADGERFALGALTITALWVPGHTPADVAYQVGDAVFVGDTLFMPDVGTARCDFPGGDARTLYRSVRRLLSLAADTRLFLCHDYPPAGRGPAWQSSVAAQRAGNIHVNDRINEEQFVALRIARDQTLGAPTLLLPAIQVNINAGNLPVPEHNGVRYLKIPLNRI